MEQAKRLSSIDYLRFILTIYVIFHHIALMFSPIGAFASLVKNNQLDPMFDYIITYTDTFFMFTFFFISGIFFFKSLNKSNFKSFIKSRFNRLIIPFLIGWLFVNALGYYVGFLSNQIAQGLPSDVAYGGFYLHEFGKGYQAGHLWFLWYLFLIQLVLGLIFFNNKKFVELVKSISLKLYTKPFIFILSFIGLAILSYWPLAYFTADLFFINIIGPFNLEISRAIAYLTFFLLGASIGLIDYENSALSVNGKITKYSPIILLIGLILSILYTFIRYRTTGIIYQIRFPLMATLAAIQTIGYLGLFNLLFKNQSNNLWDFLSEQSFAMYFYHYVIVALIQFAFFNLNLSIWLKVIIINIISITITFLIAFGSRKIDFLRKVL